VPFTLLWGSPWAHKGTSRTDNTGKFSIKNSGTSLSIDSLHKEGFRESRNMNRVFGYGDNTQPHHPDKAKPQQFLMIKDGSGPVYKKEMQIAFDWDGRPKEFEIGVGEIKEVLIVIPSRGTESPGIRGFDWKLVLKAKNGRVILARDGDAALAPEAGYVEEVFVKDDAGPGWMMNAKALFYMKTGSGKYAEIRIDAYPDIGSNDGISAYLSIRWNSSGGRSFE
jgi:hypothetical protein